MSKKQKNDDIKPYLAFLTRKKGLKLYQTLRFNMC